MSDTPTPLQGEDFAAGIPLDRIPEGGMLLGHAFGEALLLSRHGGELFAVGATCTHYGAPLAEGLVVGDTVDVYKRQGQHGVAQGLHVGHGIGQGVCWVASRPGCSRGVTDLCHRVAQSLCLLLQGVCRCSFQTRGQAVRLLHCCQHTCRQQLQATPVFHHHLAPQQVHGLDAMGAFVDHVQAVVAPVLLHRKIACVAGTTVNLDRERIRLKAPFAGPAFGDRRQHFEQQFCVG